MWVNDKKIRDAQELLDLVGSTLGLDPGVLERIPRADVHYFTEAREELLRALRTWDDDHTVPACLGCGSPRVDWVKALAFYRCQDCGAEEERTAQARKPA